MEKCQTGAMYSSVPTKEFDALIGSAMKIGFCWPLCCFFFSFMLGSKSLKKNITQLITTLGGANKMK